MLSLENLSPIIITGCHRSGTSLLANILGSNLVFMGNDLRHHNESNTFFKINEELLSIVDAKWYQPFKVIEFLDNEKNIAELSQIIRKRLSISNFYEYINFSGILKLIFLGNWGWKEPRTTILLKVWLNVFPNAKVFHIVKNGVQVADSIRRRELTRDPNDYLHCKSCLDFINSFMIWEGYEKAICSIKEKYTICNYYYEDLILNPKSTLKQISKRLGIRKRKFTVGKVDKDKLSVSVSLSSTELEYVRNSKIFNYHGYSI